MSGFENPISFTRLRLCYNSITPPVELSLVQHSQAVSAFLLDLQCTISGLTQRRAWKAMNVELLFRLRRCGGFSHDRIASSIVYLGWGAAENLNVVTA